MADNTDDTFASTLSGLEELRNRYNHDHAKPSGWDRYEVIVLQAVRSGKRLEEEFIKLRLAQNDYARQPAQERLDKRVSELERAEKSRHRWGARVTSWLGKAGLLVLGYLLSQFGHGH